MLFSVNRVREEAERAVGHPVCLLAVELLVIYITRLRIEERILGNTETVALRERALLVHFRPEYAVHRHALGCDGGDEFLGRDAVFELRRIDDDRAPPERVLAFLCVNRCMETSG